MTKDTETGGNFLPDGIMKRIRAGFQGVGRDAATGRERIYFDNAGGSFRLISASERFRETDSIPDCSERIHGAADYLNGIIAKAEEDIRIIFNAKNGGRIVPRLTASQVIWELTGVIAENVPGSNIVTSVLEHPCAFDSASFFAEKTGKELRIAPSDPVSGGISADSVAALVDGDTCLLSIMMASNISGAVQDIPEIVRRAREKKPDLYILVDAVQHAPHGIMDVDSLGIDGIMFAPYKFFGVRGSGIGYASERLCRLPHEHLFGEGEQNLTWKLGSPAPAHFAVVTAIVDYVCGIGGNFNDSTDRRELYVAGMHAIRRQELALMDYMLDGDAAHPGLRRIPGVKVLFDKAEPGSRDFIVGMTLDGWEHAEAVREYEKRGIIVYERVASNIYSVRMLNSFGIDGCIRVSPLHCNTKEEIAEFLDVTSELAGMKS